MTVMGVDTTQKQTTTTRLITPNHPNIDDDAAISPKHSPKLSTTGENGPARKRVRSSESPISCSTKGRTSAMNVKSRRRSTSKVPFADLEMTPNQALSTPSQSQYRAKEETPTRYVFSSIFIPHSYPCRSCKTCLGSIYALAPVLLLNNIFPTSITTNLEMIIVERED